jgi:tRNA (mo5U34)-methyltransferase
MYLQDSNSTGRLDVTKTWSFDSELTQSYTRVRQAFISDFLGEIRGHVTLRTAIDVGCGVGYFSKFLCDRGLQVVAVDGRDENAKEGQRRYPEITFLTRDAEAASLPEIGIFDFVLSVGLLYHLENPFRAIRNLHALTGKVLIVESTCVPGPEPELLLLEEEQMHDQGLNYVAFYPTEACLVKMLYRAGFPFVYGFDRLPPDVQFRTTLSRKQSRIFLAASKVELSCRNLVLAKEPTRRTVGSSDPWATTFSRARDFCSGKLYAVRARLARLFDPSRKMTASRSSETDSNLK